MVCQLFFNNSNLVHRQWIKEIGGLYGNNVELGNINVKINENVIFRKKQITAPNYAKKGKMAPQKKCLHSCWCVVVERKPVV